VQWVDYVITEPTPGFTNVANQPGRTFDLNGGLVLYNVDFLDELSFYRFYIGLSVENPLQRSFQGIHSEQAVVLPLQFSFNLGKSIILNPDREKNLLHIDFLTRTSIEQLFESELIFPDVGLAASVDWMFADRNKFTFITGVGANLRQNKLQSFINGFIGFETVVGKPSRKGNGSRVRFEVSHNIMPVNDEATTFSIQTWEFTARWLRATYGTKRSGGAIEKKKEFDIKDSDEDK